MFLNFFITKAHAYTPLTDIGDFGKTIINSSSNVLPNDLNGLVNFIFYTMIAVAVVLAIFGVIRGGYVYLSSGDSGSNKSRAKRILQASVGGLLLALGGWLILNTINPQILDSKMSFNNLNSNGFKDTTTVESRNTLNTLFEDGFQKEDAQKITKDSNLLAFFGEKTDAELLALTKKQTETLEGGAQEYQEFLKSLYDAKLNYENDYYINTTNQQKVYRDHTFEVAAIDSMLNRFESINGNLSTEFQNILVDQKADYQKNKNLLRGNGIQLRY